MNRKLLVAFLVVAITSFPGAFALAVDVDKQEPEITLKKGMPAADGATLWNYISDTKPYTGWALWPGKGKLYKGQEPHGILLTTYITKDAKKVIKGKKGMFKNGAIIVKENYMPDKTLDAITVMYKVKGFNPDAGDWFWAKYTPGGTVQAEGKPQGCINCHGVKKANDWVYTGEIKKVKPMSGSTY